MGAMHSTVPLKPRAPEQPGARGRLLVLQVLVASLVVTLLGRLWFVQVLEGESYAREAQANRVREVIVPAVRGEILDIKGRPLVTNRPALVVTVNRSLLLSQEDDGTAVLARLASVLALDVDDIRQQITPCGGRVVPPCNAGSPYQPVAVAAFDPEEARALQTVLRLEEHRELFPGVQVVTQALRDYPAGSLGGHLLGYLGPISDAEREKDAYRGTPLDALIGRTGVEKTYDEQLRGRDGVDELEVDHVGTVTGQRGSRAPEAGGTLVLSIDAAVQRLAEKELEAAIAKARRTPARKSAGTYVADSGSVVVMEALTGRVVAMASYPAYSPASFVGGISTKEYAALTDERNGTPLLFRAIQSGYAPASTFKVVSAASAVMTGKATFSSVLPCPGVFAPTGQTNFEAANLGALSLRTAIVKSCDTNFYKFAFDDWRADGGIRPVPRPKDPMIAMARAFGLGERTGIDLPSESPGLIPTREWRRSYWESLKDDFCQGAKNPAFNAERRARNEDACKDGFRFRGGQATNFSIGQGETVVTPLQLAVAYAAIANGGTIVTPTLGRAVIAPDGSVTPIDPPSKGRVPVRSDVLAGLRDALVGVTREPGGTAYNTFRGSAVSAGGKTGTAQVNGKQDTSWFASFAPAESPSLVVVGMVAQGGTGATTAAPMVREIYEGIFGLDGRTAALPGGRLPATVPVLPDRAPSVGADAQAPSPPADVGDEAPATSPPAPSAAPARRPRGRTRRQVWRVRGARAAHRP